MEFRFVPQTIEDVLLVETQRIGDGRGFFTETFRAEEFSAHSIPAFVQDNLSRSSRGVLRGMHYQLGPRSAGKLIRCNRGRIFDVAVDMRVGSPTYAAWVGVELSEDKDAMLWIPPGFGHGFCALTDEAEVFYKLTDYYVPELDRGFRWDDPSVGIGWPVAQPLLSAKDAAAPPLAEAENNFVYRPVS